MSEATKPEQHPDVDLLANATELLERYRLEESRLEREFDAVQIRLEIMREVIGALTARKRTPRGGGRRQNWPAVVPETGPHEMSEPEPDPMPPAA